VPKKGDFFYVPYQMSRVASICAGYLVTGTIAAPFILIDWIVANTWDCLKKRLPTDDEEEWDTVSLIVDEQRTNKQKALYALDLPHLFCNAELEKASYKIVPCSFFGKVTYGLAASTAGAAASTVASIATFVVASMVAVAVAAAALSIIAVLALLGTLFAGIGLGCTCYRRGPVETAKYIANYAKGLM